MISFLRKAVLFLCILLCLDILFGVIMGTMVSGINHGNLGKANYIHHSLQSELIILGSSKAARHYNPYVFQDSLHLSSYNCGEPGHGIVFNYGRYRMIAERYQPKIVLYDLIWEYDFEENDNNAYLGYLKPFYNRAGISEIFNLIDEENKYKMKSSFYRYNSIFLQYLLNYLGVRKGESNQLGFMPLEGNLNKMKVRTTNKEKMLCLDSLKNVMMNSFIKETNTSLLFFVLSPSYNGICQQEVEFFKKFACKQGKELIDFSNNEKYIHNDSLFFDGTHLNSKGADEFSRDLAHYLKKNYNL